MNSEIIIRKGYVSDINALVELLVELFSIENDFVINRERHSSGLRMIMSDDDRSIVFVADRNGLVVGMVTGQLVVSTAAGGHSVLLEDMCVKSFYRNKGVGTMLISRINEWGTAKGATRIQLVADKENTNALKFYHSKGFYESKMTGLYCSLQ